MPNDQAGEPLVNSVIQASLNYIHSGLALERPVPNKCADLSFGVTFQHEQEILTLYATDCPSL